jgi:acetyltransferase-like isoleucine patch superfamily enzyme
MNNSEPEITPQQQQLRQNALGTYRQVMVGDSSYCSLLALEFYNLLVAPLPGLLGFATRSLVSPFLLASCGKGTAIAKSVCLRQPAKISIGKKVIVDEYSVLDARSLSSEPASITIGDFGFVGRNSIIAAKGASIVLGEGSNIGSHCRLATESGITIGKSVLIAAYAYIGPGNHQLDAEGKPLIAEDMIKKGGVTIGDNAWIGTRATILDGVNIGKNAVVGAHSLVREDVPDGAVVAGTPAKRIS